MDYDLSTERGQLRELLGDTSSEDQLFSDAYLDQLLSTWSTVQTAAIAALHRLMNDSELIRRKFRIFGTINPQSLQAYRGLIHAQIKSIHEDLPPPDPSAPGWEPGVDQTDVGMSTDEDGWWVETDIDDHIADLKLN